MSSKNDSATNDSANAAITESSKELDDELNKMLNDETLNTALQIFNNPTIKTKISNY